jgi:methylmalonyl-CoA mutase N-terminal domain/subunit
MYRGKMWTMRQFSGMGNAAQTNERYHFLLKKGETKEIYFNHFL